jgi:hypothetical protein
MNEGGRSLKVYVGDISEPRGAISQVLLSKGT